MAHRNVGRSSPYLKIEQVGCHHESPNGSISKNILSLAKPILPDLAYAVITSNCEIGVGIGIQRLRKFLTVNHIVMATDYPHFDSATPHDVRIPRLLGPQELTYNLEKIALLLL
jgi:hypothetical protein